MTTLGQRLANRENAQKSTGPTSEEGKAIVAQNAVTHGLRVERMDRVVLKDEDGEAFGRLKTALLADLNPRNAEMTELAERIVALTWKRRRAEALETALWESGGKTVEDRVVMLATHGKEIDRQGRYSRQIARELSECRAEYRRLEKEAQARQVADRAGIDRMVELRAQITADMSAEQARARAEKAGETGVACEAAAMEGWNEGYGRVIRQARKELKRDPAVRFQAGWELLWWSEEERAAGKEDGTLQAG